MSNNGYKKDPLNGRKGQIPPGDDVEANKPGTLIFENRIEAKGYTQISNYILKDPTLSVGAKATYALILCYAWQDDESFPGQVRLAGDLGLERKAISRYLKELKDKLYITTIRRGMGKTNVYVINDFSRSVRINEGKLKREAEKVAKNESFELDVPKMGHQDVPNKSYQDVPQMGHNEDSSYKDVEEKESDKSNSRDKPPNTPGKTRSYKQIPLKGEGAISDENEGEAWSVNIAKIMEDLTKFDLHDLEDPANIYRNPKRTMKLWKKTELSEEEFIALLQEAKKITLQHSGSIRKNAGGSRSTKNRAPYFFGVLKNLIAQKQMDRIEEQRREVLARTRGGFIKKMSP